MNDKEFLFHYHEVEYIKEQYKKFVEQPSVESLDEMTFRQGRLEGLKEEERKIRSNRRSAWNDFIVEKGLYGLYEKLKELKLEHNFDTFDIFGLEKVRKK